MNQVAWMVVVAMWIDWLMGDPRWFPHPVRWVGRLAKRLEPIGRKLIHSETLAGTLVAVSMYALFAACAWALVYLAQRVNPYLGLGLGTWVISTSLAARDLVEHSIQVYQALGTGDMELARYRVSQLVGRDTQMLDQPEITRATIESVAENITDGCTSPLFFAMLGGALGGVPGAAASAMLYRVINTLDSLFGYQNQRYRKFGWPVARMDDVANYLPARLSGLCLCLAAFMMRRSGAQALRIFFRDATKHSSPNAGQTEAAMAGALGIQLGGPNRYAGEWKDSPILGQKNNPLNPVHIHMANRLALLTECLFMVLCLGMFWGTIGYLIR